MLQNQLPVTIKDVNIALTGKGLDTLEPTLKRLGRGGKVPHWFKMLKKQGSLPNMDGKTVGSVIEMLLVAVVESTIFSKLGLPPFRVNPARGVDLPDLDLGVKSPSKNFCTSEPFFSAYERLYGSEYDVWVPLTDYQDSKKTLNKRLQIESGRYLTSTQIADEGLCTIARTHREWLLSQSEGWGKKVFRFLAFVNQSDWQARVLIKILTSLRSDEEIRAHVAAAEIDFKKKNKDRELKSKELIPDGDMLALLRILDVSPLAVGVIDATDNWIFENLGAMARAPSDNEWKRLLASPLDGKIGMSFALQWRYNFCRIFGASSAEDEGE